MNQEIIEGKFTKDAYSKMEWVGTLVRVATEFARVDNWDQATEKVEEGRQMLHTLSQEPYNKLAASAKFVETNTAAFDNIEQQIVEKKFSKDSKNKMDWVNTLKSTAGTFLFREQWDSALEKIEEAKNVVATLSEV